MIVLGIDVGSSSVKAGILRNGRVVGETSRAAFSTNYDGVRAEVKANDVLHAIAKGIRDAGARAKAVDFIAFSVMAPSWCAMDKNGNPLTPIVTHQDRRSVEIARQIEKRVGKSRHLKLAGNRPFPGGISSTTCAWFLQNEKSTMRKADLVGHLNTLLLRQLTGARATDPANASFMGLYRTLTLGGWSDELCAAIGLSKHLLPDVLESNAIAGWVTSSAARRFGLTEGTPIVTGTMDTSAALLLIGAKPGQLLNVSGSTDVLALCTDDPKPHERLLTRAVGVGERWMSVSTLAAAGSAITWAHDQLFGDLTKEKFFALVEKLAKSRRESTVRFDPYLAGERTSIEQKQAAFIGLTLATTREEMLAAVIESLAQASAARLDLLREVNEHIDHRVVTSGGTQRAIGKVLYRDWKGRWSFHAEKEATLRGLAKLVPTP
jgi:xylulokinase